ncbi:MAG: dockerin type I domain-containing protein [Pirellulaceae bacterium]
MRRNRTRFVLTTIVSLTLLAIVPRCAFATLLVADRITNRVLKFDENTGNYLGDLIGPDNPESASSLNDPSGMVLGPDDNLFIASRATGQVLKFNVQTGQYLGEFAMGINGPSGLFVDTASGQLLVSEFGNFDAETIQRYNLETRAHEGTFGTGTGIVGRTDMVEGPDGKLYVGSFFDGRTLRFDLATGAPDGINPADPTATFAGPVDGFVGTNGFVFKPDGTLLAVGLFTSNIFAFDSGGNSLGEFIPGTSGLFFPVDMITAPDGNLMVSSLGNDNPSNGLPLADGYIGKYDINTGAPINPFFIAGVAGLKQPAAMLLLPNIVVPGDYNGNGTVDAADYTVWKDSFGSTTALAADGNGDGTVDAADYTVWKDNCGIGAGVASVPEPAAGATWMAIALSSLLAFRNRPHGKTSRIHAG